MLQLTAIRLINWYHYVDTTIPVRGSTLLCGDNGCGKTTILDALQLALVGDAGDCEFNRAAHNQSRPSTRRSVIGYVRYQTGDDNGDGESSTAPYERPAGTTAYIMLEFRDAAVGARDFTCGVAIDAKEVTFNKIGFFAPRRGVDVIPALGAGDTVRPIRHFRLEARGVGIKFVEDVNGYTAELRHRLGRVPENFHRLIVKALEFRPMATVKDFVVKYLAEPKPINSVPLLENIDHYRQMELEAKDARMKIEALREICGEGESIARDRELGHLFDYLVLRARNDQQGAIVEACDVAFQAANAAVDRGKAAEQQARAKQDAYRTEEVRRREELAKSPVHRRVRDLRDQLKDLRARIGEMQEQRRQLEDLVAEQCAAFDALTRSEAVTARETCPTGLAHTPYGLTVLEHGLALLRERLLKDGFFRASDLQLWEKRLTDLLSHLGEAKFGLGIEAGRLRQEGLDLSEERRQLESGQLRYHDGARGLIDHLRARISDIRVLCEVIEVPEARWRDAAEMALGARRLFMLVQPSDYDRASKAYEAFRKAGNRVYGTGIVDLERVRRDQRGARHDAIARKIETSDSDARAYVDYLLGDTVCVDGIADLRRYSRAISDTGATYSSAAMSNVDSRALDQRLIGRGARHARLLVIDHRLADVRARLVQLQVTLNTLDVDLQLLQTAVRGARLMPFLASNVESLASMLERERQMDARITGIDLGDDRGLEAQLEQVIFQVESAGEQLRLATELLTEEMERRSGVVEQRKIAIAERDRWLSSINERFSREAKEGRDSAPDDGSHERRYLDERAQRSPSDIIIVYEQKQKEFATRIELGIRRLIVLKTTFNTKHYEISEASDDGFNSYREQQTLWEESKLPSYEAEIARAEEMAVQQLAEDVVCRLHENFVQLRQDINDLNRALRDLPFGSDEFEFRMEPAADKRGFYDIICVAAGRTQAAAASATGVAELDEDLARIVQSLLRAHEERARTELEEIADYREYFSYDLRITNKGTGRRLSYNTVAGVGSGGEVQSALYIAFLASMYQMYRANTKNHQPEAGVVLLDEAFGKNDGRRIAATLEFARKFGLQLILAMPAERMDILGPQMETTLYLHKDDTTGVPAIVDFSKEFDDVTLRQATLAMLEAEDGGDRALVT